jgi:hypothetical protein
MPERLVDVEKQGSKVLHTFPVTISAPGVEEDAFKEKALEAAGNAKLVPNEGRACEQSEAAAAHVGQCVIRSEVTFSNWNLSLRRLQQGIWKCLGRVRPMANGGRRDPWGNTNLQATRRLPDM